MHYTREIRDAILSILETEQILQDGKTSDGRALTDPNLLMTLLDEKRAVLARMVVEQYLKPRTPRFATPEDENRFDELVQTCNRCNKKFIFNRNTDFLTDRIRRIKYVKCPCGTINYSCKRYLF